MSRHEFNTILEQRQAASKRLRDALRLLSEEDDDNWQRRKGHHARGAMYIDGYAVECKLKAIAMEVNGCANLHELEQKWSGAERDIYAHGLESIARRLPLYNRLRDSDVWRDFAGQVNRWRPSWRYDPVDHPNRAAAEFIHSIRAVYNWLDKNQ